MRMMKRWIALAALAAANVATAHHSFGEFDIQRDVEISGVVTGMDFVNPHSYLYLDVAQADGSAKPYRCEMRSATALRRSGWTPDLFPKGERLTILGSPARDDSPSCYVGSIRFADGTTLDRYGQRSVASVVSQPQRQTRLSNGVPNIAGDWAVEQLVMTDPRGQSGALVPLSVARALAPGEVPPGQQPIPGARNSMQPTTPAFQIRVPVEFTDVGREAAANFDTFSTDNPRMKCEPTSILFDWAYDAAVNRITQTEDTVLLEYGQYGLKRTIFVDGRAHPESITPSRGGHSIGRWEGDVLIVDTTGFAPGVLVAPVLHGERLHVVERFELDPSSTMLKRSYIAEDPAYFLGQYSGSDTVSVSNVTFKVEQCKELAKGIAPADDVAGSDPPASPAPTTIPPVKPWWKFWD